jgi:hypothetical protein
MGKTRSMWQRQAKNRSLGGRQNPRPITTLIAASDGQPACQPPVSEENGEKSCNRYFNW